MKPYKPESGDKFEVSYTTSHKVDSGVCVEMDVPVVITKKELWYVFEDGTVTPARLFRGNVEKFKKL